MKRILSLVTAVLFTASIGAGEFPDITIKDLKAAIEAKKVTVIDVNGTQSFKNGRIPTAYNYAEHKGKLDKVLPKDKTALVVAYCGGPTCKAYQAAATEAEKLGYKNVKHLSAGISGWLQAGEKTDKGG